MGRMIRILLTGGTGAGRRLAESLAARLPKARIVYALAGATDNPCLPHGENIEVRIGGFGGVQGLAAFLREQGIAALVDATHPHARRMPAQAAQAAALTGVSHARFLPMAGQGMNIRVGVGSPRPAKRECTSGRSGSLTSTGTFMPAHVTRLGEGHEYSDRSPRPAPATPSIFFIDSIAEMAHLLPRGARVFAALGSRGLAALAGRGDLWLTARMISPPTFKPPSRWRLLRGRAAMSRPTIAAELALLRATKAQWLLARESIGSARLLQAARLLGIPALLLRRPAPPPGVPVLHTPAQVLQWLKRL